MSADLNINPNPTPNIDPLLRRTLERNLLKYAVGRSITCPACGQIMDCRRAVLFGVFGTPPGAAKEIDVKEYIQCARCWDARGPASVAQMLHLATAKPELKIRWEIVDGRTVFSRTQPRKA